MSLLHQNSPEASDDAARGEAFTRGTSHIVVAAVVAAIVVSVAIGFYVFAGQKPPAATGEIVAVWACPLHYESSGLDANGEPMAKESLDQVLVFARVRLHNQSKQPLFLIEKQTNVTLPDGIHSSTAATAMNYERIFQAYPKLAAPHLPALATEATLEPGQTVEGSFLSSFKLTKQEWDARKDLNFSFSFRYQPRLVLSPRVPVQEQ
jgi:hypothetical protein